MRRLTNRTSLRKSTILFNSTKKRPYLRSLIKVLFAISVASAYMEATPNQRRCHALFVEGVQTYTIFIRLKNGKIQMPVFPCLHKRA